MKKAYRRYIKPYQFTDNASDQLATVGRVFLELFEVEDDMIVDAVILRNGATIDGSVTVGIYGNVQTEEICAGLPLVIESNSTPLSGTQTLQVISLTPTLLKKGRYYLAVEYSSASHNHGRGNNATYVIGWGYYYDRVGGYGALTTPCPATTSTGSAIPLAIIRTLGK